MSTVMEATELDGKGLDEVKLLTDAIRTHQTQIQDLGKRRKQLILRLRKQRIPIVKLLKQWEYQSS
jgi:hypothetical protein